jgi:hypothetical protein
MSYSRSSAQGYVNAAEENEYLKKMHAAPPPPSSIPQAPSPARTRPKQHHTSSSSTPTGKLIYQGAIDDKPTTDQADLKGARNYLNETLTTAMSGRPFR